MSAWKRMVRGGRMTSLFVGLVLISAVALVIGCCTWRSGGRNLVLLSGAIGAGSASMLTDERRLQLMLAAVFLVLLFASVLTIERRIWRTMRAELLIGATALLMIGASSIASTSGAAQVLLPAAGILTMVFLVMLGRRAFGALRVAGRSK